MFHSFKRCEEGNALVEAAIIIPVAVLLLAGGFELARGINHVHAAERSVRDVARYMARLPDKGTIPANADAKALVTADNALGISPADLVSVNVTIDPAKYAAHLMHLRAVVTYRVLTLSPVMSNPDFTFAVEHETPLTPEVKIP